MTSVSAILSRLVGWGLVDADGVLAGGVEVRTMPGRHGAMTIETADLGLFVKTAHSRRAAVQIAHEAAAFATLASNEALSVIAPSLVRYDRATSTLVLGLVRPADAPDDAEVAANPSVAARLGRSVAILHSAAAPRRRDIDRLERPPWLAELDLLPLRFAVRTPWPAQAIARLLNGAPGVADGLGAVRGSWTPSCLCHMDLRLDNVVASPGGGAPRIVDWEEAAWADPAWDVGWVIGSFLSIWVRSMPTGTTTEIGELVEGARRPLSEVRDAVSALWREYRRGVASPPPEGHITRCAALRLASTAMERVEMLSALDSWAVLETQLAARMLERPEAAARELLGLS